MNYFAQTDIALEAATGSTVTLLQYGLAGVVIIGLAFALVKIYGELQKERQRNSDLQEKRLEDLKGSYDGYKEPINEIARQQKGIYELFANLTSKRKD